jgi:N-acetylglucosaminyldiphosphoundecaprenol N-acetyl-beta-D-mannosaminyltransferase
MVVAGIRNKKEKEWLSLSDYIIPDGNGIVWALKKETGRTLSVQTGVALVEAILTSEDFSVYFWGGSPDIQSKLQKNIRKQFPRVTILGMNHGYTSEEEHLNLYKDIAHKKPDIIFIGMGYPKQEDIIYQLTKWCSYGCAVGVGGVFDVLSGHKKLAPLWVRVCRLEWLYRGLQDPKRMLKWGYLWSYIWMVLRRNYDLNKS